MRRRRRGVAGVGCLLFTTLPDDMAAGRVVVEAVVTLVVVAAAGTVLAMEETAPRQGERNFTTVVEDNLDKLVDIVDEGLGFEDGDLFNLNTRPTSSFGNIVYSTAGFILGGLMLFVSIFDTTRMPVIMFFESIFGGRQTRRRREVNAGLDAQVAAAFHVFTSAVDKMDVILRMTSDRK